MKIVTYLLGALLAAAIGAAALFYFMTFQPMYLEYERMKTGMPGLEKAQGELRKYKAKETQENQQLAWAVPVMEELSKNLAAEITAGKAEIAQTKTGIIVNIAEDVLYTPRSVTFAGKDAAPVLQRIAAALAHNELKGKEIIIGNSTDAVPAQGKGKKKILPKEARTLSAERSLALARYLEQNKVDKDALVAAGYPAKLPDNGLKIKDHKTIITIQNPAAAAGQPKPAPAPAKPEGKTEAPSAPDAQPAPKTIPLKPAEPKGQ